ncbi:TPA: hypothetical protein ACGBG5_003383 [Enterococcus faecalis]
MILMVRLILDYMLLDDFKCLLRLTNSVEFQEISSAIEVAIVDIQKEKNQSIEVSVQLSKVTKLVNNSLAFNGLKLTNEENKAWEN